MLRIIFSCDWEFFPSNWEKKLPNLHWEWGLISARDTRKKSLRSQCANHSATTLCTHTPCNTLLEVFGVPGRFRSLACVLKIRNSISCHCLFRKLKLVHQTLAIRTTVVPITPLIGTTVVRISGVIRTTGKSISKC